MRPKFTKFTEEQWAFHIIHSKKAQSDGSCVICNVFGWNYTR